MRGNSVYIILILFLVVTLFFWFHVLRIKDLPPPKISTPPVITGSEAEAFIKLAQEFLIDYREPLPQFYTRDPFYKEPPMQPEPPKVTKEPSDVFVLSSIVYDNSTPLAVVNGKILAEGDRIFDKEFESGFMIEEIGLGEVEINNGEKKYTLKLIH